MNLNAKELKALSFVISIWGFAMIACGYSLETKKSLEVKKIYTVKITSNESSEIQEKRNDIKLKKIEIEVGNPISTNAKDYLEEPEQYSELQLKEISETLDTSLVNINQPGTYKYTLSYKKKKYESTIKVNEKEIPDVTFTLKSKIMPTTGTISRDKKDYIYEELTPEIYNNIILDLREIEKNQSIPGKYKYTVTYKDTIYYGDFEIVEDVITNRITITCPQDATLDNNNKTCICNDEDKEYDQESKTCKLIEVEQETEEKEE